MNTYEGYDEEGAIAKLNNTEPAAAAAVTTEEVSVYEEYDATQENIGGIDRR